MTMTRMRIAVKHDQNVFYILLGLFKVQKITYLLMFILFIQLYSSYKNRERSYYVPFECKYILMGVFDKLKTL